MIKAVGRGDHGAQDWASVGQMVCDAVRVQGVRTAASGVRRSGSMKGLWTAEMCKTAVKDTGTRNTEDVAGVHVFRTSPAITMSIRHPLAQLFCLSTQSMETFWEITSWASGVTWGQTQASQLCLRPPWTEAKRDDTCSATPRVGGGRINAGFLLLGSQP